MASEKEASEESALEETALEETVVGLLKKKKMTLSLAESCTGGAVAADIVNVPGASEVFMCGYVTYTNRAKRKCLGVKKMLSQPNVPDRWQKAVRKQPKPMSVSL